jgi:hypothetical protein
MRLYSPINLYPPLILELNNRLTPHEITRARGKLPKNLMKLSVSSNPPGNRFSLRKKHCRHQITRRIAGAHQGPRATESRRIWILLHEVLRTQAQEHALRRLTPSIGRPNVWNGALSGVRKRHKKCEPLVFSCAFKRTAQAQRIY